MKVGVVGFGKMGLLHTGILNALPDCSIVAICEKEAIIRRFAKKIVPQISFYDDLSEMMENHDLNAVYITTPVGTHASIVEELTQLNRKFDIFIEKPLAGNVQDAEKMVGELTGNLSMVGFQKRFSHQFQRVKNLLENGALGDILFFKGHAFVSGTFNASHGWRFEPGQGGALIDLGAHLIDLVLWYFGYPRSVMAVNSSFYSERVEDYSHITFQFGDGIIGHVDISWSIRGYRLMETQLEIHGKNGSIIVNDDKLAISIVHDVPGVISEGTQVLRKPEFTRGVDYFISDPEYCLEDQYFLRCIRTETKPVPGPEAGLMVNKIMQTIHSAAKNRKEATT